LRKSIALRYSEIEFERLADLEQIVTGLAIGITGWAKISVKNKSIEQGRVAIDKYVKLNTAIERAEIFLTLEDGQRFLEYKRLLLEIIDSHVGYQKPTLVDNDPTGENLIDLHVDLKNILRERIKELGKY
jgi:hypothetical protein